MYINFHKYNYNLVSDSEKSDYELRDKNAYKEVLTKWFNENLSDFVDRKWEIGEIHYLKQIGDFIKLLQEAENLYELGFYTSCTALIGVSAEDFSKYLSLQNNKSEHITKIGRNGGTSDVSQYDRLLLQLNENIISQNNYDLLDEIRLIRNDCLHYNQNFKQKPQNELKNDALKVLNNLKIVLKEIIGNNIDPNDFEILLDETFKQENTRNFEELIWKHRNMFSHLLNFHITQAPDVKIVNKYNIYKVRNIDNEEIDLTEFNPQGFPTVIVDIDEKGKELIRKENIKIGDIVVAKIYSNVDINGQTSLWYIDDIKNYSNL